VRATATDAVTTPRAMARVAEKAVDGARADFPVAVVAGCTRAPAVVAVPTGPARASDR
jgi:hypothetical protein